MWLQANVGMEMLRGYGGAYCRVRYEDLVKSPEGEITRIMQAVSPGSLRAADPRVADDPSATHLVSGNPMRFDQREPQVTPDVEWMTEMPAAAQRKVVLLTFPLLLRYGYEVAP
jgi:hypothetical protein